MVKPLNHNENPTIAVNCFRNPGFGFIVSARNNLILTGILES